ncbi:MAG: hypothetical protein WDW36_010322 [Sanguina aurantia]
MYIGIDFGTSYSAAAAIIDGALTLVRFGDAEQFRTAVFFPELVPDPSKFTLTPALSAQLESELRSVRAQQRQLAAAATARGQTPVARSEDELHSEALRVVRRQWMEDQTRNATASVASFQHALFGEAAVEGYLESGGGNLIESPKSMFGYRLDPQVRRVIVHIATHIIEHIRLTASRQFGVPVRGAVIGRPVEFRSSMGAQGSVQAACEADLKKLEEVYRTQDLYVWLAYRLPRHSFPGLAEVMRSRERCSELIEQGLEDLSNSESEFSRETEFLTAQQASPRHTGKGRRHMGRPSGRKLREMMDAFYDEDEEEEGEGGGNGDVHREGAKRKWMRDFDVEFEESRDGFRVRGHGGKGKKGRGKKRRGMFDQDADSSESWTTESGRSRMAEEWSEHHQEQRKGRSEGKALWHCRNEPIPDAM